MDEEIIKYLSESLKKRVNESKREAYVRDDNCPSFDYWCIFCEFVSKIVHEYPVYVDKNFCKRNEAICSILFEKIPSIDAHDVREKVKKQLIDYCNYLNKRSL